MENPQRNLVDPGDPAMTKSWIGQQLLAQIIHTILLAVLATNQIHQHSHQCQYLLSITGEPEPPPLLK